MVALALVRGLGCVLLALPPAFTESLRADFTAVVDLAPLRLNIFAELSLEDMFVLFVLRCGSVLILLLDETNVMVAYELRRFTTGMFRFYKEEPLKNPHPGSVRAYILQCAIGAKLTKQCATCRHMVSQGHRHVSPTC